MQIHHRPISESETDKIQRLLSRAANNESISKRGNGRLFGKEFQIAYNVAVDIHRQTGYRRESGHPSIVHTLEVALGMLGYANSYFSVGHIGRAHQVIKDRIISPYSIMEYKRNIGVPDFELLCLCVAILHDAIEDTSKKVDDIERNRDLLLKRLGSLDRSFSEKVVTFIELLTNNYAILLKAAHRYMPVNVAEPIINARRGLEELRSTLLPTSTTKYVSIVDNLLHELDRLNIPPPSGKTRDFYTRTSSIVNIVEALSFRAYSFFTLDILRDAQRRFKAGDASFDIPILVKRQDAFNNIETMNLSTMRKIKRALAKAEMVQNRLDSDEISEAKLDSDINGIVQFLTINSADPLYINALSSLALELRYLMIRACTNRIDALSCIDAHSVLGQLKPFLLSLERKYRKMYEVPPEQAVALKPNPLEKLWKP